MKKTLTVNLGGIVFNIDEDAYQLLDKYLINLRSHFKKQEEKDEIMNDIEMRISELFSERISMGYQVITIEDVEEVIKRMGKPEEIFDNDYISEETPAGDSDKEKKDEKAEKETKNTYRKRLMRDPDERILGGVSGGIAAYLSVDVTAVRLVFILLLFFFFRITIPIYLILWLVMPMARTAMDKLQMRGEKVDIENIGKTVTEGFESVSHPQDNRSGLRKFFDGFVAVIGFMLKALGILIGIILLPIFLVLIFVLFVVTIALLFGGVAFLFGLIPFFGTHFNFVQDVPTFLVILNSLSGFLLIGIPAVALIYLLCGNWFKLQPMNTTVKWTLLAIWIIALVVMLYSVSQIGWSLSNWHFNLDDLRLIQHHIVNTLF